MEIINQPIGIPIVTLVNYSKRITVNAISKRV
uniref:Uncharacterized protein n=1 Tax=Siphoviridae sp. cto3L1 TaxID=2827942 RepID=A0A8S5SQK6_9CAUD|nr:MAG TPA: hypothetical protein [Siphoviridae sp. cto3L1]